ncbi:hypothetical protein AAC387_Pa02g1545 [Persea americana]
MRMDSSIMTNPSLPLRTLRRKCCKTTLQEEAAEAATPIRLLLTETHFFELRFLFRTLWIFPEERAWVR